MPELPEVEVIRSRIAPILLGRRISRVSTGPPSPFFLTPPQELARSLGGRIPVELARHGKHLLARLENGGALYLHLGMTGQLFGEGAESPRLLSATARASLLPEAQRSFVPDAHTQLVLGFADGGPAVCFRDVRKFGRVRYLAPGEREPRLERLGVDALLAEADALWREAKPRRVAVKLLLLDQSFLAGVGNIYADEALFESGIAPTTPARRLGRARWHRLLASLRRILARAIQTGGSSIRDYVTPDGSDGGYQDERRVYARTGMPCLVCGTPIARRVLGQRATHHCPRCQR
jgi:formamidopyrimidine-DNA glycosylase